MKKKSLMLVLAVFLILPAFMMAMSSCAAPKAGSKTDTEAVDDAAKKAAEEEAARLAREEAERQRQQQEAEEAARMAEMKKAQEAAREAFLNEMANFDYDKYNVRQDAEEVLRRKAEFMAASGTVTAEVQGHCDERGTEAYNMALGDRRANAAKNFMESLGVAPDRMTTVSYGEEKPLTDGHDEAAWSQNRRAQFVILSE
ncbi:MAG: peptidoglycan-associated lipoprotein Pal [Pseudomonadota bacterium]